MAFACCKSTGFSVFLRVNPYITPSTFRPAHSASEPDESPSPSRGSAYVLFYFEMSVKLTSLVISSILMHEKEVDLPEYVHPSLYWVLIASTDTCLLFLGSVRTWIMLRGRAKPTSTLSTIGRFLPSMVPIQRSETKAKAVPRTKKLLRSTTASRSTLRQSLCPRPHEERRYVVSLVVWVWLYLANINLSMCTSPFSYRWIPMKSSLLRRRKNRP